MKVIDLGECRELLARWDEVRQHILNGEIAGFTICMKDHRGREAVFLAGEYEKNPVLALKAAMEMSRQLTKRRAAAGHR